MVSHLNETLRSPYSPKQIYDLVADVASYPQFLPWCVAARILENAEPEKFDAELVVRFKQITESYVSRVTLSPADEQEDTYAISAIAISGPFQTLANYWKFMPDGHGGCVIELNLEFAFRSRLLQTLIGMMFAQASKRMAQAFLTRAEALYGEQRVTS